MFPSAFGIPVPGYSGCYNDKNDVLACARVPDVRTLLRFFSKCSYIERFPCDHGEYFERDSLEGSSHSSPTWVVCSEIPLKQYCCSPSLADWSPSFKAQECRAQQAQLISDGTSTHSGVGNDLLYESAGQIGGSDRFRGLCS